MECCGRQSYLDYSFKGYYPTSCCKNPQDCRYETVFKTGCKEAFVHYWDVNADIIKYAGLGVAAIEVSSTSISAVAYSFIYNFFYFSLSDLFSLAA